MIKRRIWNHFSDLDGTDQAVAAKDTAASSAGFTSRPATASRRASDDGLERIRWPAIAIALLGAAIFLARLTGPAQVCGNEWRLTAYVLDALQNGHWACQTDTSGDVASKPPLLTWLVSLPVLLTGQIGRFALYWPNAIATILTAVVLFKAGTRQFGERAGLFGAFVYLASGVGFDQMAMPRYDGLLALPVTLGALAAYRSWETGRDWTWFWVWVTLGTFVKGPVALLMSASGLCAVFWMKRAGDSHPLRGKHWLGVGLFLALTGAWFAWAYTEFGPSLIDKMIWRELVGHAVGIQERGRPLAEFYRPSLVFLAVFAPWSLVAVSAFWRVIKKPSSDTGERRFERFLFCWFFPGLIVFSLAAHQRNRLIYPLIPAAALLVGRELARWTASFNLTKLLRSLRLAAFIFVAFMVIYTQWLAPMGDKVQKASAVGALAKKIRSLGEGQFPMVYANDPNILQALLMTRVQQVSVPTAVTMLKGEAAVFVVVDDVKRLQELLHEDNHFFEVFRGPEINGAHLSVISNQPRLEWARNMGFRHDGLKLEIDGARLLRTRNTELFFSVASTNCAVVVSNEMTNDVQVTIHYIKDGLQTSEARLLTAGATWRKQWEQGGGHASRAYDIESTAKPPPADL